MAKKKDIEKKQKAVQTSTPVETKTETSDKKTEVVESETSDKETETVEEKTEATETTETTETDEKETETTETEATEKEKETESSETETESSETEKDSEAPEKEVSEKESESEEKEKEPKTDEKETTDEKSSDEVEKESKTEEVKSEDKENESTNNEKDTSEVEKDTAEVEKESTGNEKETAEVEKESEEVKKDTSDESKESSDDKSEDKEVEKESSDEKETTTEVEPKTTEKQPKTKKFILYDVVWVIIGLVAGILISFCIFNLSMKSAIEDVVSKTQTNTIKSASDISKITTYSDPSTIITDADKIKEVQKSVEDYANGLKKGSTYSQVMTGQDQYVYYLYNTNGEVFTQDTAGSYTELFLKDGKVFKYDNNEQSLSVGSDIDLASLLVNGIDAVGNDNVTLYEMKNDSDDTEKANGHEYRVDLKGEEAVKLLYKSAGDEFATSMVDSIKSSISDWEPHIIMVYFIGDTVDESYSYCLYVIDDQEYTNWFLQGYDTTNDWSLDDAWYSYDSSKDTDGKQYSELATKLVGDINTVMNEYADSKGWLTTTDGSSTESTETTTETK